MKTGWSYIFLGIALVTAAIVMIWPQFSLFLASDACLGSGGSYDFLRLHCDFQQGHPYVTFKLWPFWAAIGGAMLGVVAVGRGLLRLRSDKSHKPEGASPLA